MHQRCFSGHTNRMASLQHGAAAPAAPRFTFLGGGSGVCVCARALTSACIAISLSTLVSLTSCPRALLHRFTFPFPFPFPFACTLLLPLPAFAELLASPSDDGSVYVWDYASAALVMVLRSQLVGRGTAATAHPQLPLLATCGSDSLVRLWSPGVRWLGCEG
jgi:hypothetical protein